MYRKPLEQLRAKLFSFEEPAPKQKKNSGLILARVEPTDLKAAPVGDYSDWLKSIRAMSEEVREAAQKEKPTGTFASGLAKSLSEGLKKEDSPDPVENVPEANRETFIRRRSDGPSYYAPRPSKADTFLGLIDKHEGGGSYDTLFQHSNKEGKAFSNIQVSKMTLGEVKAFASARGSGSYYQWSKDNMPKNLEAYKKGLGSTPMGRYQFVGSTLKEVASEMGLSDDTVFSPEVQDAMFEHYLQKRISMGKTLDDKVEQIRSAWEGFRNVDRKTLETLIIKYEG